MTPSAGTAYVDFKGDFSSLNREVASRVGPIAKTFGGNFGKALGPVMDQQAKHLRTFTQAAKIATVGAAGLAAYGFKDVLVAGSKFEKQMSVNAAVSEATRKQMGLLEKQALKLGQATFYSAGQAGEAQTELLKGGLKISQVLGGGLPAALALAEAGELDLAVAAETTVNAMKLFGLEGKEAGSVADMLSTAANRTTADVEDFAMALKQGGSVTKLAGYDMNETVTVLEALAEAGIKNSDAGTSMKTAVIQLLKPTEKQAKLAQLLGIEWETQNGTLKDAAGLSKELRVATDGMTKAERAKTFATLAGTDGVRTLNALYSETPAQLRKLEVANAKQGTAQEIAKKKMDNVAGSWEQFKGSVETAEIQIYQGMAPALGTLADEATVAANRVGAIFSNEHLSGSEKLEKAIEVVSDEVGRIWEKNDVTEHLFDALDAAIPIVAEHAGQLGLKAAEGFGRGFIAADPLGKAVMATWLLHFIGGKAPFVGIGKALGKQLGFSMAAEAAATAGPAIAAETSAAIASSHTRTSTAVQAMPWLGSGAARREAELAKHASTFGSTGLFGLADDLVPRFETQGKSGATAYIKGWSETAKANTSAFIGAGTTAARSYASSFASSAGPAVAAIGIGNIAASALNNDWKDAGFEAGGALAGGVAGFILSGGNPLGAMLGVGLGSIGGELGADLFDGMFDSGQKITPLQEHLRASAKHVAEAFRDQKVAVKGLATAHGNLHAAEQRQKQSTSAVHQAEQRLSQDRKKYGADSNRVKRDELLLADAKQKNAAATREVNQAHRLSGAQLKLYNHLTVVAAASSKNRIHDLREEAQASFRKFKQDETNNGAAQKASQAFRKLNVEQRKLSDLYEEAGAKSGPRLQRTIESLNQVQANYGRRLKGVSALQAQLPRDTQTATQKALQSWGTFTDVFKVKTAGPFKSDVLGMAKTSNAAMGGTAAQANEILRGWGVNTETWSVNGKGEVQKKQDGGYIVPGSGDGDRFRTVGEVGAFVMNREATRAYGLQSGGHVPLMLEAGERYFTRPEVQQIGRPALEAANSAVKRFQKGGTIGAEPILGGPPGGLRALGQAAIHEVYKGAKETIAKNRPKGEVGGAAFGPKGIGTYKGVPMANWVIEALQHAASKGVAPQPTSGYRSHAENVAAGRTYFSEHEKTQYPGGAVDFGSYTSGLAEKMSVVNATRDFKYPLLAPIGFRDDGHASGTGHMLGGLIKALSVGGPVPPPEGILVGASYYGGPTDGVSGTVGAAGVSLPGKMSFAELAMGKALGGLDFHDKLKIGYNGKSVIAEKLDIGLGGDNVGGKNRAIDLWYETANAIGMPGTAVVKVSPANAKETDEHSYKEDVPATYKGCRTDSLDLPSMPKSLKGVEREIDKRAGEVVRYRRVAKYAAEKDHRPGVAQALQKNVTTLETWLTQLRRERHKLRFEKAKKKLTTGLAKKVGKLGGYDIDIARAERAFRTASQTAEQIVGLEPQQPELPASATEAQRAAAEKDYVARFADYVNSRERPAYTTTLERAADWRNTILKAEYYGFGKGKPSATHMEIDWEAQVGNVVKAIRDINDYSDTVANHLKKWKHDSKDDPKAKMPKWLSKEVETRDSLRDRLPFLRVQDRELRGVLGEARQSFYPGGKLKLSPPAIPLEGSGSFEDALIDVQGIHWPDQHELLPASALAPPRIPGRLGGEIWGVQEAIEELGLKAGQASNSLGGGSGNEGSNDESAELLKELLRQANQRVLVSDLQRNTIAQFNKDYPLPPFGGVAHTGAIVPGPSSQERTMIVRGREGIFTEEQMAAMGEGGGGLGGLVIEKLVVEADGSVTAHVDGQEVRGIVKQVIREETTSRGLASTALR